jgi:sortase (surface protein transpeptidase)
MSEGVIVAILALIGTLVGTFGGILTANKLTNYRIEQLENKVEKHNKVIERVFKLEEKEAVIEEKISVANHRIDDLEQHHK